MKPWGYLLVAIPVGLAAFVGCAEAPEDEPLTGILGAEPGDASDKGSSIKLGTEGDDDDTTEGDDDDTTPPSASSTSSAGGPKDAGAPKDAGPPPPPPTDPCSTNACSSAKTLGAIPGDLGAEFKTFEGAASRWLTINIEERDETLTAKNERVKVTLTSPASKNFDLFVYRGANPGTKECQTVAGKSESATDPDTVSLVWGEGNGGLPNGSSDTRTVTVEVREVGAGTACVANDKWTLKVEGNK